MQLLFVPFLRKNKHLCPERYKILKKSEEVAVFHGIKTQIAGKIYQVTRRQSDKKHYDKPIWIHRSMNNLTCYFCSPNLRQYFPPKRQ